MARALRLLAQREHSRAELERKLLRTCAARGDGDAGSRGAADAESRDLNSDPDAAADAAGNADAAAAPHAGPGAGPGADPGADPHADSSAVAGGPASAIASTLDELERGGWLDDHRAAEAVAGSRAGRWGARRIARLMQERAFPAELIAQTLDPIRRAEPEQARAVWQRRFGHAPLDPRERARQVRFLVGRGFDVSVAVEVVRRASRAGQAWPDPADDSTAA